MSGQLTLSERVIGWADIGFGAAEAGSTAHLEVAVLLGGSRAGWYRDEKAMAAVFRRAAPAETPLSHLIRARMEEQSRRFHESASARQVSSGGEHGRRSGGGGGLAGLQMIFFDRGHRIVSVDGEWDYRLEPEANVLLLDDADQLGRPPRLAAMLHVDPDLSRALPQDRRDDRDRTEAEVILEHMQNPSGRVVKKVGYVVETESGERVQSGAAGSPGALPPELLERLRHGTFRMLQANATLAARLRGDDAIRRFIAW